MIRKLLLIVFVISTITLFSGCVEKIVYVDREVPYAVPVKCDIPDVYCSFDANGSKPIMLMLECIINQKKAMRVCDVE